MRPERKVRPGVKWTGGGVVLDVVGDLSEVVPGVVAAEEYLSVDDEVRPRPLSDPHHEGEDQGQCGEVIPVFEEGGDSVRIEAGRIGVCLGVVAHWS